MTERNLTEEALREPYQTLQALIQASPLAIVILDTFGTVQLWSPAAERLFGWKEQEVLNQPLPIIPLDKWDEFHQNLQKALQGQTIGGFEARRQKKDGSPIDINVWAAPLRDRQGKLDRILALVADISYRQQAKQSLERYAERLKILQDIDQSILAADSLKEIVHAALSRMSGLVPSEQSLVVLFDFDKCQAQVISENLTQEWNFLENATFPLTDFIPKETLPLKPQQESVASFFLNYPPILQRQGGDEMGSYICLPLIADEYMIGEIILGSFSRAAFTSESLEILSQLTYQIAIAIRQAQLREQLQQKAAELEQRVIQRTAELQEVNTELEAFVYSVSHDLRAPLRAMQGFSEALLEDYGDSLDAKGQEYAQRISHAAERMETLIQELLNYSHLSRTQINLQPTNLAAVVNYALSQLKEDLKKLKAKVTVDKASLQVMVLAHQTILVQVVTNLVTNAVKFVQPGVQPIVQIWAEEIKETASPSTSGNIRLWIVDNGIGISPENQERIFQVFERLHGREAYPGTGIGLAIVRKGIERMGGRVGVVSHRDRGSQFWLELGKG